MKANIQKLLLEEIAAVFRPLVLAAPNQDSTIQLFKDLGWDVRTLLSNDVTPLTALLAGLSSPLDSLLRLAAAPTTKSEVSFSSFKSTLLTTKTLGNAVQQLSSLSMVGGVGPQFYEDVLQKLFAASLVQSHQRTYHFFLLAGVIVPDTQTIQQDGYYVKFGSKIPLFSFSRLLNLLKQPRQQIADTYWPNGLATDFATPASTAAVGQRLFLRASMLLNAFGIPAAPSLEVEPLPGPLSVADIEALKATMYLEQEFPLPGGSAEVGLAVGLLSAAEEGPGLYLGPRGAIDLATYLGNWLVELNLSAQLDVLAFKPSGTEVLGGSGTSGTVTLQVSNDSDGEGLVGNQMGTSLQLGRAQVGARLDYTASSYAVDVSISLIESILSIYPDEGDSFLNRIVPANGLNVRFSALLGWSSTRGLYFGGRAGLRNSIPVTGVQVDKFLSINTLTTELLLTDKLLVRVSASGEVKLGPAKVSLERVGITLEAAAAPNGGNAGPFNVMLDFAAPQGVGIAIDSDTLTGGGYLYFNPAAKQYAGVAHLTLHKKISLNAVGLLQTELPAGRDGYSLLLLITATGFQPIQLGLGFTLNGLGGLVGVNRAAHVPYLRGLLSSGQMDQLLFPANVLDHPAAALAVADGSFPATEGRYVFGLLAKIGWGTPPLLTLDVGLVVELPAPVRLLLLGVLRATLPSLDKPILRLRADFVGSVDFGAGSVEFDAVLRDSSLLDRFTLSGDGAFRLYQGQHPVFLLTTGGFHPAFQPPANANLRPLQRLRLALADSSDFRLVLHTYLALTANTVQVGARLDLFVDLPLGFYLEGYLYFDTLFQFHPFRLDVQIGAGVAIKRHGKDKLSLQLYLHVTGPAPWHVTGEVSFKLIVRVRFSINRTIGGGAPAQPLPNVDVRQLLLEALAAPSSWEVQAPSSAPASPVVLRAEPAAPRLLVDPLGGALVVRQQVAPLAYPLERYGNARPANGTRFDITQAQLGTGNDSVLTGADLAEITDFFAPGEFRQMSEAQRLSAPSFQLMRSGVRLATLDGWTGGPATVQKVGYELLVLAAPVATGTPIIAPAQPEASLVAAPATSPASAAERRRTVDMPARQFQQLSQRSTINQAYATAQPSYLAPAEVYWQEDAYVLVRADTLTRYAATTFANEAQATAALQAAVTADSRLRGELLVVPAYQLALESV